MGRGCRLTTTGGGAITIGPRVSLAHLVEVNASNSGRITIEEDCLVGPGVYLRASNHRFDDLTRAIRAQGQTGGTIQIGADCWLGARVLVLSGVSIGAHSVIGAGSVVTHSMPAWSVAAGNPCQVLRSRQPRQAGEP